VVKVTKAQMKGVKDKTWKRDFSTGYLICSRAREITADLRDIL
jgi:hypothetical protein